METTIKEVLDRVHADEALKQKTADYIRSLDANVISIKSAGTAKKPVHIKRFIAAACAAVVLCALPIGTYAVYKTPTSYISVDINPSVELGINTFGKVVKVTPYNTEGETVLDGLSLLNQNVESAVRQIVTSAAQNGYMTEDGSTLISVTAETNNPTAAQNLETAAKTGAEDAVASENNTATVETDNIALDRRGDAIALGITPGKLNLIEKLQVLDPSIKTEDYKDASVTEIQKKCNELKKEQKSDNSGKEDTASASPAAPSSAVSPTSDTSPTSTSWPGWQKSNAPSGDGKDSKNDKNSKDDKGSKNNNGKDVKGDKDDKNVKGSKDNKSGKDKKDAKDNKDDNNKNNGKTDGKGFSGTSGKSDTTGSFGKPPFYSTSPRGSSAHGSNGANFGGWFFGSRYAGTQRGR